MKRIKGDKDKNPILRVRKPTTKPGHVLGKGKGFTRQDRKKIRQNLKRIKQGEIYDQIE